MTAKKFAISITDAPTATYRPTVYLSEEFESYEDANTRYEELVKNLDDYGKKSEIHFGAYHGQGKWSTVKFFINW